MKECLQFSKISLRHLLVVLVFVTGSFHMVDAAQIGGHSYPEEIRAGKKSLKITGVALYRYWGFKAYTGAFYIEEGVSAKEALSDRAKRLELAYYRHIKGSDIGKAAGKLLARNLEPEAFDRIREKLDYLKGFYQDVAPGDRCSLTYIPGRGTELAMNGKPLVTIPGAEFAEAIFSIWLGNNPIDRDFKRTVLGMGA